MKVPSGARFFVTLRMAVTGGPLAVLSGIVAAIAVNCLYFALQKSEVVVISPIASANPLVTLMLAWLFLSQLENVNRWLFLGMGITVTGVVLVVLGSQL